MGREFRRQAHQLIRRDFATSELLDRKTFDPSIGHPFEVRESLFSQHIDVRARAEHSRDLHFLRSGEYGSLRAGLDALHRKWGWYLALGIALVIVGLIFVSSPVVPTLAAVIVPVMVAGCAAVS